MATDRNFNSDESARRKGYSHSSPKDSNFNPRYAENLPRVPNPANTLSIVPEQDAAVRTAKDWQRTQDMKKGK